ncbi:MAG: molybdate ABC transporter permease subunit [Phototrophicales bacterium]|nr:MAG: molybdate ABC transporter permease subunit [Phototrophicales bacterium]RMG77262.1 MAG: molybdate ABC transporter permease subunit [Chloroflexota bacterium]
MMRRFLLIFIAGIAILFLSAPIGALVVRAIQTRAWQTLQASVVTDAVNLSLTTTFFTVILTLLFGTPLAYLLARGRFVGRRILNTLVELPIVLPPAVAGLALLLMFGRRGVLGPFLQQWDIVLPFSTTAVVLAQTFVAAPFYVRAAQVGFSNVPRDIEEAAQVDGAGGMILFLRITIPLSSRTLLAGVVLCWARALGEFGATILFAGSLQGRTQTMPLLIYNILERDVNAAVATGVLLVVLALIALLISQSINRLPSN